MRTEFRYREERSYGGRIVQRPVAKVTLIGPNSREVVEYMYIDSGADFTMIPYRLGVYLGLGDSYHEVEEVQGISGAVGVILGNLDMKIGTHRFSAKVAWAQIEHVPLLLERTDVFDKFKVTFTQSERKITFDLV